MISCDSGLPHNTRNDVGNSRNVFEVLPAPEKPSHPFSTSQNFWDHLFATWDQVTREVPWDVKSETRIADFNNASSNLLGIKRPAILSILLTELIIKMYDGSAETHYLGIALHPVVVAVDTSVERQIQICNFIFFPSFLHFLLISVFSSFICLLISHLSLFTTFFLSSPISDVSLFSHSSPFFCVRLCFYTEDNTERSCTHVCRQHVRVLWDTGVLTAHMDAFWKCTRERLGQTVTDTDTFELTHTWTETHPTLNRHTHIKIVARHAFSFSCITLSFSCLTLVGSLFLLLLSVCLFSSLTFSVQWQWQGSLV